MNIFCTLPNNFPIESSHPIIIPQEYKQIVDIYLLEYILTFWLLLRPKNIISMLVKFFTQSLTFETNFFNSLVSEPDCVK